MQLLRLWRMQTDMAEHQIGAAICGRLKGPVFQFAMCLKEERLCPQTGTVRMMEAPDIFSELEYPDWQDPATGVVHPGKPNGSTFLCQAIMAEFSGNAQDLQWQTLAAFIDLYRSNSSFEDFIQLHDLAWIDDQQQGGIAMNEVGRSFFLLRAAQLTERQLFDVRMRVNGDLSKYKEICQLMTRMFSDSEKSTNSTVPAMASTCYGSGQGYDDEWYEDDYGWYGDEYSWDSYYGGRRLGLRW